MKLQKRDTLRQTKGMGKRSFTIPARMIGTEHKIVTNMVNTILSNSVIAASILVIIKLFKRLAIDSALKRRKGLILSENGPNDGSSLNRKKGNIYPHPDISLKDNIKLCATN
ncbi:hypothetical protein [Citrobacter tructae]|jgi:hypothetical protein|uniref:hypothetical protein n=1 Tax=Citrobacter TaxID=544 RepID=UPI001F0F900A|nr:hypothetical protein [Citrobacter tructae]